ncbi:tRNA (adenosine(37)-N6)-threonylcarbamoyltransferase complex dimerization subunit type 1 TsaB [Halovulum dunhuangense]|uniref:tRNA (Adenosine(37)-N6)-threonylcarbamoyltransferase complex dimerization subunit type 1 TsaB n=1 Tax=Halovulum dunhuangense TaxID=1505036 RepID=A0A849L022_9RHOB|nr:tRNA (adenosine(37)-N6)-threonylcarbamoyltransferase complex dimerization subunit type 1 TsaB [Halovulum dunhuangense]NNU78900.1 tRNA (adenosine(37)-N6)-threonylcarbamoyltransferase complex dimerization subunit type 1 TsaB [Halovulum dunhuangense]
MRILAIDTAAAHCAAALLEDGVVRGTLSEVMGRGQAERLVPMAQSLLEAAGTDFRHLDAIAVGIGPGNFTGIRISVSTARGLALALGIPAIGVSTFEALAWGHDGPVLVALDAGRDRLYVQGFRGADLSPRLTDRTALHHVALPPSTLVLGHDATRLAGIVDARPGSGNTVPAPEIFAMIAATRAAPHAPPAPLYLRTADAALPAEGPPTLLD